ncbi:hypothetical protein ACHAPA_012326 [Fusarium lateritium]
MSYYDRSPTRSSRNNDTSFRGLDIEDIHAGKAIQWDFSDKIIFYRHMARYQITGRENVNRGLSELERDLGIQDRSTWYKQPILEKATASILYNLNQHCLRLRWTETISIQPPFYTAILPVLQEYQHITLQSAHLPIGFILKDRVPLTVLRRHREAIEALCYEIKEVGGFWNEANGLRLDPAGYRKARRYRHDVPSGAVDMYDLCESVVRNVCAMEDMFYDAVYAVAHGLTRSSRSVFLMLLTDMAKSFPPTSNDTKQQRSDPLPVAWLASFRETVEMNGVAYMTRDLARDLGKLNKTLQITLGEVNLLLHIAATYFSQPTTWWHLLRQSHSPQLEPIGQIHANLTLIATKGSSIITTQTAVLEQEDSFLL